MKIDAPLYFINRFPEIKYDLYILTESPIVRCCRYKVVNGEKRKRSLLGQ